jgi:predicted enzyme related to lactoylglutathione lyase
MSGKVVHFEIPADDAERAQKFYAELFGWQLQPMPEVNYTLVSTGPTGEAGPTESGYINGGLMRRGDQDSSDHPVITIDVQDIDETLKRIEDAGGSTVSAKMDVMGMGWAAYFKDTEGNVTGLWQNA